MDKDNNNTGGKAGSGRPRKNSSAKGKSGGGKAGNKSYSSGGQRAKRTGTSYEDSGARSGGGRKSSTSGSYNKDMTGSKDANRPESSRSESGYSAAEGNRRRGSYNKTGEQGVSTGYRSGGANGSQRKDVRGGSQSSGGQARRKNSGDFSESAGRTSSGGQYRNKNENNSSRNERSGREQYGKNSQHSGGYSPDRRSNDHSDNPDGYSRRKNADGFYESADRTSGGRHYRNKNENNGSRDERSSREQYGKNSQRSGGYSAGRPSNDRSDNADGAAFGSKRAVRSDNNGGRDEGNNKFYVKRDEGSYGRSYGRGSDDSGNFTERDSSKSRSGTARSGSKSYGAGGNNRSGSRASGTGRNSGKNSYNNGRGRSGQDRRSGSDYAGGPGRASGFGVSGKGAEENVEKVTGRIEGNPKGFAFLIRDDGGEDIFIPPNSLGGAAHGDTVEVATSSGRGKMEGQVITIVKQSSVPIIGTYVKNMGEKGIVIPDDPKINRDIEIESRNSMGAATGDKVVAKIFERKGKRFSGKIIEVLGDISEEKLDTITVIRQYELPEKFSSRALSEARKIPDEVPQKDFIGRYDFRNDMVFTIDGDDSRDFDDAVSLTKKGGKYELAVHIADVSHYVGADSALDSDAFDRGTSVYFPDMVLPMLPEKLSNNICSLNENTDRLTLSCLMTIDKGGQVVSHKITNGVITSKYRLTYSKVAALLDGDTGLREQYSDILPMLENMRDLAEILGKMRRARGAVDLDIPECKIITDEEGHTLDIVKAPRLISHRIIEEFMLAANETVAKHMSDAGAPFVYRAHMPPSPEKAENLSDFVSSVGLQFEFSGESPAPMDYRRLLDSIEDDNIRKIVSRVSLRSMTKASYEPQNKGHFGLAAEYYCHFTSPIRRYPDLIIHRIIKDYLVSGKKCFSKYRDFTGEASLQSSIRERLADEAERAVDDLKKARFMSDKIGEEYDGTISGVTEWGVFVELENTVEGLVRLENLPGGSYAFDPVLHILDNKIHKYRLGDALRIRVLSVSKDKIEFGPGA